MFKLAVIVIVVWIVWKKLNASNKQIIKDKMTSVKTLRINTTAVKEASRSVVVRVLVGMIGILTGLLSMVLGNQNSNLPAIKK